MFFYKETLYKYKAKLPQTKNNPAITIYYITGDLLALLA